MTPRKPIPSGTKVAILILVLGAVLSYLVYNQVLYKRQVKARQATLEAIDVKGSNPESIVVKPISLAAALSRPELVRPDRWFVFLRQGRAGLCVGRLVLWRTSLTWSYEKRHQRMPRAEAHSWLLIRDNSTTGADWRKKWQE